MIGENIWLDHFCCHEIQTLEILGNFVDRITELNNNALKSVLVNNTIYLSFRIVLDIMYIFNYVYTHGRVKSKSTLL